MGSKPGDKLKMVYEWSSEDEKKFDAILTPLITACGLEIDGQSVKEHGRIGWQISLKPDILITSSPLALTAAYKSSFKDLAALGAHAENYPHYWIDAGSPNGQWQAVPVNVNVKSLIWYNPALFNALGYAVPTTLDELIALVEKMTTRPAAVLGIPKGTLRDGADADITVIDPAREWTVDRSLFLSRGKNSPFQGWNVKGKAVMTIVGGVVRYRDF